MLDTGSGGGGERPASAHKLKAGLVRNAAVQIRMTAFWIVSKRASCDGGAGT